MTKSTHSVQYQWQVDAIATAGYEPDRFIGVEHQWWQNSINPNSLRLTSLGHKWFTQNAKFKSYQIDLTDKILPRQMLQLERLIKSPYYIKQLKTIYVYGEQDAVMLQLHGGNLVAYLDNLENQG